MRCDEAREALLDLLDAPLAPQFPSGLELHLQHCDSCRAFFETHRRLDELLAASIPPALPSMSLRPAIRTKLKRSRETVWSESLPDLAHWIGCAAGLIVVAAALPQHSSAVLVLGAAFAGATYVLQTFLCNTQ